MSGFSQRLACAVRRRASSSSQRLAGRADCAAGAGAGAGAGVVVQLNVLVDVAGSQQAAQLRRSQRHGLRGGRLQAARDKVALALLLGRGVLPLPKGEQLGRVEQARHAGGGEAQQGVAVGQNFLHALLVAGLAHLQGCGCTPPPVKPRSSFMALGMPQPELAARQMFRSKSQTNCPTWRDGSGLTAWLRQQMRSTRQC